MAGKNTPGSKSPIRARQRRSMGAATRKRPQSNDLNTCQDPAIQHQGFVPFVAPRGVNTLRPNPRSARTHSAKQIRQIAASIREFGFITPALIDAEGRIIAGHGRVEAAKMLGMTEIPTIRLDHMSEAQMRAYAIADNRLAELAGWDDELIALELQYLSEPELDFQIEITGFETAEIDILIEKLAVDEPDEADAIPEFDRKLPPVSKFGDLWLLGKNRLLCGDALKPESLQRLMDATKARMVFIDPPYNVRIDGHVCGLGAVKHADFAMASGEMSEAEFTSFLAKALSNLAGSCSDGSLFYVCMDWRHLFELLTAGRNVGIKLLNICVWNKTNAGMGSFYRSQHELVCVFKAGDAPHLNTIELGQYGRYRTNVWDYPGANTLRPGRIEDLRMHPTLKPVALVVDAIKDCTRRGDIVLDAFAGSGSTVIAAERTGRVAHAIELEPNYIDVAIRRWQQMTGEAAIHAETGRTFDSVSEVRDQACEGDPGGQESVEVADG